jgi:hypothetical protein
MLPADVIETPPPSGWPQITPESLQVLGKTRKAIQLLQNIPYIQQPDDGGDKLCVMRKTWPVPYNDPDLIESYVGENKRDIYVEPNGLELPAHVICLAQGARDAYFVLVDTERGVIVWGNPDESWNEPITALTPKDIDLNGVDAWMYNPTFEVAEFFDVCKQRFRDCRWMPHPFGPTDVWEAGVDEEDKIEEDDALVKIMKDAGWPGDGDANGWRREEAEQRMEQIDWM